MIAELKLIIRSLPRVFPKTTVAKRPARDGGMLLRMVDAATRRRTAADRALTEADLVSRLLGRPLVVETPRGPLRMAPLGRLSVKRGITALTREPDSLAWIDRMAPDSTFWDIGANVGVLSLYAGLRPDMQVMAFEPAAVNYYTLCANVEFNGLCDRVACLPLGFGSEEAVARMEVSQFAYAQAFSFTGKRTRPFATRQAALLTSLDAFRAAHRLAAPHYLKIDVHGLTLAILEGGRATLSEPGLREVQIELKENPRPDSRFAQAIRILEECGLTVAERNVRQGGGTDFVFARAATPSLPSRDDISSAAESASG